MVNQNLKFDIKNIKAIIGLGNPGPGYYKTRHSIGFRVVDEMATMFNASFSASEDKEYCQIKNEELNVYLLKPLTFMNSSGKVLTFLQKKGVKSDEILVIHDELERKFDDISLKFGGSAKGHNGLKSIIDFGGPDFWRLRFGIGRPDDKANVSTYVLSYFSKDEENQISSLINQAINLILQGG
ncbi:MAG: peptidyl-tRNA hydrolase [candidate division TM6 bacterium GW2011_GWF2_37_49]|nr:MAG: peptidyl-tRNA hydrolase [candidate division TM6 bacterium GW2011_GWF2_37_49]